MLKSKEKYIIKNYFMEIPYIKKEKLANLHWWVDEITKKYSHTAFLMIDKNLENKYKFFKDKFNELANLEIPEKINIWNNSYNFSQKDLEEIKSKIWLLEEKKKKILLKMKEYDYMISTFEPLLKWDYWDLGNRFGSIEQLSSIKLEWLFKWEFDLSNILNVKEKNPGYLKSYSNAVETLLNTSIPLSKDDLLDIHKSLLTNPKNSKNFAEQWIPWKLTDFQTFRITKETWNDEKDKNNITFVGPKVEDIDPLLDDYVSFYNQNYKQMHPIIFSSILMIQMSIIHPFGDWNSRMSRLIASWSMRKMDYSQVPVISYVFSKNKDKHEKKLKEIRSKIVEEVDISTSWNNQDRFIFKWNEKELYYNIDYSNWIKYFIDSYIDWLDFVYDSIINFIFNLRSKDFVKSNFKENYKFIDSQQIQEIYTRLIKNYFEFWDVKMPEWYINKLKKNLSDENKKVFDEIISEIDNHFTSLIIKYS